MNKWITALLLFISSSLLAASNSTPVFQISNVKGAFIQVPLTHDIYRYSQRADLGDLQVLDANQTPLPWRLVKPAAQIEQPPVQIKTQLLAFYPVAADASVEALRKTFSTHIDVQGGNIHIATEPVATTPTAPDFYLIDIRDLKQGISDLIIDWDAQAGNQYLQVALEGSANLQNWQSLQSATLVQITQEEQTLKHNRLSANLNEHPYEFLRLKVTRGANKLRINSITAEEKITTAAVVKRSLESWSLAGEKARIQTSDNLTAARGKAFPVSAWEFQRDEKTPIETVDLDLVAQPYGDSALLYSRSTPQQGWQLRYRGIWFNTQVGTVWQKSEPITLPQLSDKYWRLELAASASNISNPQLVFTWQPAQLHIIANAQEPFSLVFNQAENNPYAAEQIFQQIIADTNPTWSQAQLNALNVQPMLLKEQKPAFNWKQWIFWLSLLLAVVILLWLALRLFKQLNLNGQAP